MLAYVFHPSPELFATRDVFTLRDYMHLTGVAKQTAAAHVRQMVSLGITRCVHVHGQTHYYRWPAVAV